MAHHDSLFLFPEVSLGIFVPKREHVISLNFPLTSQGWWVRGYRRQQIRDAEQLRLWTYLSPLCALHSCASFQEL